MPEHRWDTPALDALTAKLVRRFGPAVTGWVTGAPGLATVVADLWELRLGEPFADGASSVAIRATTADGRSAVLKLSPDVAFLTEQATVLRLFAPGGRVPEVLAHDHELGALLLAAVSPGTPVHDLPEPPDAVRYARLLAGLHAAPLPPPGLLPRDLRGLTDEFVVRPTARRLAEPVVRARLSGADLGRTIDLRDALLAEPVSRPVLLHGDLHLGNVLDGGPVRGLVAIDPKSCVGDPCFDAVDYVVAGTGRDGIASRLDALAAAAELDRDRLLRWCRVIAPVTAVLLLRRGGEDRAVDELLALTRD